MDDTDTKAENTGAPSAHVSESAPVRLLSALLFGLIYGLIRFVVYFLVIIQTLIIAITKSPNENIARVGLTIRAYIVEILDYLTGNSYQKPFPFNPLPSYEEIKKANS